MASLSNLDKAASMLVCLGIDQAAQVLAHLSHHEVQLVARQMAHTGRITRERRQELMEELRTRYVTIEQESSAGGMSFVQRLLSETFGEERAALVMEQLTQTKTARPFGTLRTVDGHRILDMIAGEHPSVIALVLYYLPRDKAAQVMAGLADSARHEVVMRLVSLQNPLPQTVARLEQLLTQRLTESLGEEEDGDRDIGSITGARALVEILGRADPNVERRVYEFLQEKDPELAEEVRKSMFVFEDIARLEARAIQLVLREMTSGEIALTMKNASEDMKALIFNNVSENVSKTIKEELELLGPVRMSKIEEAQQKVVATVRRLADEGTISIQQENEQVVQ